MANLNDFIVTLILRNLDRESRRIYCCAKTSHTVEPDEMVWNPNALRASHLRVHRLLALRPLCLGPMSYIYPSRLPLSNFSNLLRDFETIASDAYGASCNAVTRALHGTTQYDKDTKTYFYEVALPGYSKEEVTVSVEESILTIAASSKARGDASLTLALDDIDEGKISAKLEHGLLRVSLPLVAKPAAKKIVVS